MSQYNPTNPKAGRATVQYAAVLVSVLLSSLVIALCSGTVSASLPTGSVGLPPSTNGAGQAPILQVDAPLAGDGPGDIESAQLDNPAAVLHDQFDNAAASAGSSQNFEPAFDIYDDQGADDFTIQQGAAWTIDRVQVAGVYSGTGAATSVNVFFYQSATSQPYLPSTPVISQTNLIPTNGLATGSFDIELSPPVRLTGGAYWLSVQANQNLGTSGQWFWRDRYPNLVTEYAWRNPGGGFQTYRNCLDWGLNRCAYRAEYRDQMFRLYGVLSPGNTPTGTPPTAIGTRTPTRTGTAFASSTPSTPSATRTSGPPPLPVLTAQIPLDTSTPMPTGTPPTATLTPSLTPTPGACGIGWREVTTPSGPTSSSELYAVDAISPNDVWAAGTNAGLSFILHWNGVQWTIVPSPNPGIYYTVLYGLEAISSNDVWAVGAYGESDGSHALTLHWDGSQWTQILTPTAGTNSVLRAVSAISANNVWAVGYYGTPTVQPLSMHWDGITWNVVSIPMQASGFTNLLGVAAVSNAEVWAVGTYNNRARAFNWNGSDWQEWPLPVGPDPAYILRAIEAVSADDIWAVGQTDTLPYVVHWDGVQWERIDMPAAGAPVVLNGLTAVSANDIWAVGVYETSSPLLEHWNGSVWSQVPPPNPAFSSPRLLYDAASTSSSEVWTAGQRDIGAEARALTFRYNDPCAGSTPTSTLTSTAIPTAPTATPIGSATTQPSATRTATRTTTPTPTSAGTATATGTPTACLIQFEDVPTTNTFYANIRCLACRGIINGYPCGGTGEPCNGGNDPYFRPGNLVTRGQLAKIVSNSAGMSDPPVGQTFEDVLPGTAFYTFTERLASRGVMGGYQCGIDPNEPCGPANLPYFRPGAGASRGQLTKIVSNAAGFSDPAPGTFTFTDVPAGSTFHVYVERLLLNRPGAMGGYPCGGANPQTGQAEPCDAANRPYFRPSNSLSRGQTAKIVGNTFFPGCSPLGQ